MRATTTAAMTKGEKLDNGEVLARKSNTVIGKLINKDQAGYLKGRNISSVIRTVDDVKGYLSMTKKSGCLLALDYQKAFDSISDVGSTGRIWVWRSIQTVGLIKS